jgi:hypothetical protein
LEAKLPPVKPPEPEEHPLSADEVDQWAEQILREPDKWLDYDFNGLKPNLINWAEQRLKMREWEKKFDEMERERRDGAGPTP